MKRRHHRILPGLCDAALRRARHEQRSANCRSRARLRSSRMRSCSAPGKGWRAAASSAAISAFSWAHSELPTLDCAAARLSYSAVTCALARLSWIELLLSAEDMPIARLVSGRTSSSSLWLPCGQAPSENVVAVPMVEVHLVILVVRCLSCFALRFAAGGGGGEGGRVLLCASGAGIAAVSGRSALPFQARNPAARTARARTAQMSVAQRDLVRAWIRSRVRPWSRGAYSQASVVLWGDMARMSANLYERRPLGVGRASSMRAICHTPRATWRSPASVPHFFRLGMSLWKGLTSRENAARRGCVADRRVWEPPTRHFSRALRTRPSDFF